MFREQTAIFLALLLISGQAWASPEAYPGYGLSTSFQLCNAKAAKAPSYHEAVQCMEKELPLQRAKMQSAHARKLSQSSDLGQKQRIERAQSLWLQHTEEACAALRSASAGDATDVVLECQLLKTARRALELDSGRP